MYVEVGALTHPAQGFHPPLALTRGRAQVKTLSIKNQKQRPGPSRSWWASHSLSPNGLRPWLPGPCVFGGPSSVGSTGAHGQRQSFGIGKGLPSAPKGFWLPAAKPSVHPNGSHWWHGEPEAGGSAPALGSGTRWLGRMEGDDKGLPLDTTHKTVSLHVWSHRRRIIPTTSALGDFAAME